MNRIETDGLRRPFLCDGTTRYRNIMPEERKAVRKLKRQETAFMEKR